MTKKIFIIIWSVIASLLLAIFLGFWMISIGWIGYMPDLKALENPVNKFASQVISADGKLLGTFSYQQSNRIFVGYDEIPTSLKQALIATEDVRFEQHSGIDFRAVLRAVVKRGIMRQKQAGGGSTLTQQLAKQIYSKHASSVSERLFQKPIEWVIAVELEKYYTKEEIITMYLNYFDFLHNAVGLKTAAKTYFNKEVKDLTINESALLVGMCKNPALFNPVGHPERALERRNLVLELMCDANYLDKSLVDTLKKEPIVLDFHRVDHKEGEATYVREYLRKIMMSKEPKRKDYASWQYQMYYDDSLAWQEDPLYGWCNKHTKKDGTPYNIYNDGLKIYTTINSRMQHYAEEALVEHVVGELQPIFDTERRGRPNAPYAAEISMEKVQQNLRREMKRSARYASLRACGMSEDEIMQTFYVPVDMTVYSPHGNIDTVMTPYDSIKYGKKWVRAGFVCMDVHNGAVKAYVGGTNFTHFQYDMAGKGRRQVGSTIKPYLYALAMENGFCPCDEAPNEQRTYGSWTPRNGSKSRYGELVSLKWGLATSNNWISAYLMDKLNPPALVRLLHSFGIQNQNIQASMALCLGPCDISVLEMVSAYTTFPNKGIRSKPLFVTRIEDRDGNVIDELSPRFHEVISEESSYKMIELMRGVVDSGTGARMRGRYGIHTPMGGKTGTTNDNTDGWFVGYTPSLSFGAWVGGDERDTHFNSTGYGQGAASALPICAKFLKKVFNDPVLGYSSNEQFSIPADFDPCNGAWGEMQEESGDYEIISEAGLDDLYGHDETETNKESSQSE